MLAVTEIVGLIVGAGAVIETRRGEAGVRLQVTERAVISRRTGALKASSQGNTLSIVQAGN